MGFDNYVYGSGIMCGHSWGIGAYRYFDVETNKWVEGYGIGVRPDNPHDFTPDYEFCTEAEIDAWRAACAAYDEKRNV